MTGDLGERTSLSSYRFVCAMIAQLVIQGLALPMVHHFGQGNNAVGYQYTIGIFSALAVVLFLITFATTKERIQPPPGQKAPISQHFADLLKNGPWLAMFVLTLVLFITLSMRGSVVPYYFNYFVDKASLARLLAASGRTPRTRGPSSASGSASSTCWARSRRSSPSSSRRASPPATASATSSSPGSRARSSSPRSSPCCRRPRSRRCSSPRSSASSPTASRSRCCGR